MSEVEKDPMEDIKTTFSILELATEGTNNTLKYYKVRCTVTSGSSSGTAEDFIKIDSSVFDDDHTFIEYSNLTEDTILPWGITESSLHGGEAKNLQDKAIQNMLSTTVATPTLPW
tara:strand:- start:54 stop:398 length:345 start_codon:yes stop_codon:yes gene_type:complete